MVSTLQSAVEREVYGRRAAEAAGVATTPSSWRCKRRSKSALRVKKKQEVQDLSPAKQQQPRIKGIRYDTFGDGGKDFCGSCSRSRRFFRCDAPAGAVFL